MKDSARQHFRWAPHASGAAAVKPKDYELGGEVEAATPYAAWAALHDTAEALCVGDILESENGTVCIYKYVGFDEATWVLPEVKSGLERIPAAAGPPRAGAEAE
jgi:hypothetical protein